MAHHEAGHAVFDMLNGFGVAVCSIDPAYCKSHFPAGLLGGVLRLRKSLDGENPEIEIALCLSGIAAETFFESTLDLGRQEIAKQWEGSGWGIDITALDRILTYAPFHWHNEKQKEMADQGKKDADAFVRANWEMIEAVAGQLSEYLTLTTAQISEITGIEQPTPDLE